MRAAAGGVGGILILCLVSAAAALDFKYHHTEELEKYLRGVRAAHPSLTHLHSIGRSVEGRDLWVLVLGRFPTHHKIGIPEFKYVANMHGDETVGREILLHLIDFLVTSYGRDPVITRLLNNTRVHIMPTMNPDGFEATKVPDCYYTRGRDQKGDEKLNKLEDREMREWEETPKGQIRNLQKKQTYELEVLLDHLPWQHQKQMKRKFRYNRNGADLNRNFPDAFENNSANIQPETQAVMDWIKNETFVLSANLHGGALVASYTFDNGNPVTGSLNGYSRSPDDDVFIHLAKTYSSNHASMSKGTGCDNRQTFPGGITNGYSWYQLEGGMQDYNYVWGQCFEITLELSCCKYPPADQLEKFWRDNKVALIEYIKQVHLGVKGQVTDKNGNPIPDAIVEVKGRPHVCPYRTNEQGEYFLLLLPGTYVINATVPGFKSMLKTVEIPDNTGNFSALKQDFSFPEVSDKIRSRVASCPRTPLYQELTRASAAVKPTVHVLVLMTVTLVIFK